MTASRLRLLAVAGGLIVVGPVAVVALAPHGALVAVPAVAMAALALVVLRDNRRLAAAVHAGEAALTHREGELDRLRAEDPLTRLANRGAFVAALTGVAARGEPLAVVLVDVDGFAALNAALGHDAADEVLIETASRVRATVGATVEGGAVLVARTGGDELAVVLEGTLERATERAEAVHAALRLPFALAGGHMVAGVSIGIAHAEGGEADPGTLLREAEMALGAAKRAGAGATRVFRPELAEGATSRLLLRAALATALDADALELNYQPIVELVTGRVWGVEALSRWTDGERGPVAPAEFIPLSEETGLIHQLGRLVLAHACAEAAGWPGGPAAPVLSVNLSTAQLEDAAIVDEVADALRASGLAPERLMVEVPDAALLDQGRQGRDRLAALRELGVRVAVDGFGAGSSSLRHLPRFPVDVIKIDQALVRGIDDGAPGLAVLRAIVDLADHLGLETVAEGVEEIRQADALASIGCRSGQGFWYRRPVPPTQLWPLPSGEVLRPRARAN
jgi:diguanylate cyclase (GGDEF)-like protein